jgi:large subunit ribosomal protein L29
MMSRLKMKSVRELNEGDLKDRIEQMRTELSKLQVENAKGTLRKESGKIKRIKRDLARLLTRLNEMKKK